MENTFEDSQRSGAHHLAFLAEDEDRRAGIVEVGEIGREKGGGNPGLSTDAVTR